MAYQHQWSHGPAGEKERQSLQLKFQLFSVAIAIFIWNLILGSFCYFEAIPFYSYLYPVLWDSANFEYVSHMH